MRKTNTTIDIEKIRDDIKHTAFILETPIVHVIPTVAISKDISTKPILKS